MTYTAADLNSMLMRPLEMPAGFFPFRRELVTSTGERLSADDRLDMMAMLNRFDWSLLAVLDDDLMGLMTEDVIVDHGFGYAEGKPDSLQLIKQVPALGLRHHFTNHVVFITADGQAAVAAYMLVTALATEPEPTAVRFPQILDQNVIVAVFRRDAQGWLIQRLTFDQAKLAEFSGAPDAIHLGMGMRASERTAQRLSDES